MQVTSGERLVGHQYHHQSSGSSREPKRFSRAENRKLKHACNSHWHGINNGVRSTNLRLLIALFRNLHHHRLHGLHHLYCILPFFHRLRCHRLRHHHLCYRHRHHHHHYFYVSLLPKATHLKSLNTTASHTRTENQMTYYPTLQNTDQGIKAHTLVDPIQA